MTKAKPVVLEAAGREVTITNPTKVFFPEAGHTKLDLARYFLTVADGALRGIAGRPVVLKRYVNGADAEPFFQKRAPENRPDWIETVELRYPSGGVAREVVVNDVAQLLWIVNLGCIDLNPHPVRADDLEHPDELRVDLDPGPGVEWADVRKVALVAREVLDDVGLVGWPKTSGSRGIHINVRIARDWLYKDVRRAALALAREVARRAPDIATARWWKEERHGVFIDYNQNAKDRTVASAWSVRATPDARVSMPLDWDEVADVDAAAFNLVTAQDRFRQRGDPQAGIDEAVGSLAKLLELAAGQEAAGEVDEGEKPRANAKSKSAAKKQATKSASTKSAAKESASAKSAAAKSAQSTTKKGGGGRRQSIHPLITIANAQHKDDALAGLARWKAKHPDVAELLAVDDILIDAMRGKYRTWTRIRINLRHVPEADRPAETTPDPDYDPSPL